VVATNPEFKWLESPLWSESGKYVLFSDVKWEDEKNVTCGMIWKYSDADGLEKFLECSGLAGPGDEPDNISDYIEAGSNGLVWGWKGEGDLLMCQHGKSRIARLSISDVQNGQIDPNLVSVLTDEFNGTKLNTPNDMFLHGNDLYFTDPPFGLQFFSAANPFDNAFKVMPNNIRVYMISGDPEKTSPVNPAQVLDFGRPDPRHAPNGVVIVNDDIICPITDFNEPRVEVFSQDYNRTEFTTLKTDYRIEGDNADFPPLNDGTTYSPDLNVLFVAGPGGIYMYDTNKNSSYKMLGFLRLDDLVSNVEVGGGYLWMTANQRFLRIPLVKNINEVHRLRRTM